MTLLSSNIAIRKTSTAKLILFTLLSLGIYWYVWLWKLVTDINKLYPKEHSQIHRYNWFCALIGFQIISIILCFKGLQKDFIFNLADILWLLLNLTLTLQILKNIELYVNENFSIPLKHNVFGWLVFGSFYVNYKINRLNSCIQKGIELKIEKLKLEKAIQQPTS